MLYARRAEAAPASVGGIGGICPHKTWEDENGKMKEY